jgi:predicted membrane channel-forming protein YqfA (hemolysin III family)
MRVMNEKINILVLDRLNNTKNIELTLASAFVEANTALFHICNREISNINKGNEEVFFYLYNSQNSIVLALFNQAFIVIDELFDRCDTYKIRFIYLIGSIFLTCIISYFLVSFSYSAVGKRKESYLEVFFQIDHSVKKNCLDKCEKFSKKIQSEDISEGEANLDEAEMIADETHLTKTNKKNNIASYSDKNKKRKNNSSRENNIIKFKISLALFFIIALFSLIYYFYFSYLTLTTYYIKIFNITSQEQSYHLFMHNLQREYFSDPVSSKVWNYPSSYLFNKSLEGIYDFEEGLKNV